MTFAESRSETVPVQLPNGAIPKMPQSSKFAVSALIAGLKRRGVSEALIDEASSEVVRATAS